MQRRVRVRRPLTSLSPCRSLALGQQYSSLGSQPILCGSIPGLVPKQLRFCRNYIEIMPSVAEGVKLGIQECQHQFRGRRWNCTTIKDNLAIFGPVLDKGKRCLLASLLLDVITRYTMYTMYTRIRGKLLQPPPPPATPFPLCSEKWARVQALTHYSTSTHLLPPVSQPPPPHTHTHTHTLSSRPCLHSGT